MICKYCGIETDSKDGICKTCHYKLSVNPNPIGGDIYSSSGMLKKSKTEAPEKSFSKPPEVEIPINAVQEESYINSTPAAKFIKAPKSKGLITVAIVSALVLVVLALYLAGVFKTNTVKIDNSLSEGNYTAAYSIFEESFTAEGSAALNKMLELRLDSLYDDYRLGNREYSEVKEEFDTIEKMGIIPLKAKVEEVKKQLSSMRKSKNGFKNGEKYYSKKNYARSIKEYAKVIKEDSNYSEAKAKAVQAVSNYRNTVLSEAAALVTEGECASAVKLLKTSLEILEDDKLIKERIEEYGKSANTNSRKEIIDVADEYAFNGNYAGAITVILTAIEKDEDYSSDELIMGNLEDYRELYVEQFSEKIDEYIAEERYEEAAELLKEAERVIPGSKTAAEKEALLEGKMPDFLNDLTPVSKKEWSFNKGGSIDSFGSDHSGDSNYILLNAKSTATYDLKGDYDKFKCSVVAGKNIDSSVKCKVEITASVGGEYLYRECEISAETEAEDISMVVKDCTSLTISVTGEGAEAIMFNARLISE